MVMQLVVMSQVAASGTGLGIGLHCTHGTAFAGAGAATVRERSPRIAARRRVKKVCCIVEMVVGAGRVV